jgi:hypothetical protein
MKISKETRFDSLLGAVARKGGIDIDALTKNAKISSSYIDQFKNNIIKQRQDNGGRNNVAGEIKNVLEGPIGWLGAGFGRNASPATVRARPIMARSPLNELPVESMALIPSACLEPSIGSKKRYWNTLGRIPLPFRMGGLRRLKARPKNLLAVKVIVCGMASRFFDGNTVMIGRSEVRMPTDGDEMSVERLFTLPDGVRAQRSNASVFEV